MLRLTRKRVQERAGNRCEYCGLREAQVPFLRFHVEHIRARQHGGGDSDDNLCLACPFCNQFKGPNQSAYDPETGVLVPLFNPRTDARDEHFVEQNGIVIGRTPQGRATVALLEINREALVCLRQSPFDDE